MNQYQKQARMIVKLGVYLLFGAIVLHLALPLWLEPTGWESAIKVIEGLRNGLIRTGCVVLATGLLGWLIMEFAPAISRVNVPAATLYRFGLAIYVVDWIMLASLICYGDALTLSFGVLYFGLLGLGMGLIGLAIHKRSQPAAAEVQNH